MMTTAFDKWDTTVGDVVLPRAEQRGHSAASCTAMSYRWLSTTVRKCNGKMEKANVQLEV